MRQNREDIIRNRLTNMANWANQRSEFFANPINEWNDNWYVRIGGNGFTAVSLDLNTPLIGFSSAPVKNIETVKMQFLKKQNVLGRPTPEKRAQAWIIKQALNNKLNIKTCLGLNNNVYDELLFALDELSFGDINNPPIGRLDILAVGIYHEKVYPVFIELKSGRQLTGKNDLIPELQKYISESIIFESELKQLLCACVGRDVDFSNIGKIIIWPKSISGKASNKVKEICNENRITLIESDEDSWNNNEDFSFHPVNEVYAPVPYKK